MDSTRRDWLKAAGAASIGMVAGCTGGLSGTDWQRTLGFATPTTGPLGFNGQYLSNGANVALDEFNAGDAEDIQLSVEDTAAQPQQARSVVQGMIDDNIPALTGTVSSDVTLAIKQITEEEEVPHLTPVSGTPDLTTEGTNFNFRMLGDEEQKAVGTLQFFASQDVSRVAIIAADFSYPRDQVQYQREYASAFDIEIGHVSFVPFGTNNFRPELNQIDAEAVDAIFTPYPGQNGVTLVQQIRETGLFEGNVILGDIAYSSNPFRNALGEDIVGIYNWGVDLTNEKSRQLESKYEERFDVQLDTQGVRGYDATKVMTMAMQNADPFEPVAIRDELRNLEYDGAGGYTIKFGPNGHLTSAQLIINQWTQDGGELRNDFVFKSDVIPPNPSP